MKKQVIEVSEILKKISKIDKKKIILNGDGGMNLTVFQKMPEIKKAVYELRKLGISKEWLLENGFVSASMVLKIK